MPFIVATYVYASSQGQRTHSARTKNKTAKSGMVNKNNLVVEDDGRYVDDARVYLYPVRAGWRWEEGGLWFRKEWEEEDALLSPIERTKRVVFASMQGLTK